jgi:excinuclease ABC subunit C
MDNEVTGHRTNKTAAESAAVSLALGIALIRNKLKTMPGSPGVYRMLGMGSKVLYVGKARNLKKRVATYANAGRLPVRLQRMVAETREMEIVTTHTEVEALLLESNLIKTLKPHYNILLRDDKSFADILIAAGHDFPQLIKHRGAHKRPGKYYGPFASAGAPATRFPAAQLLGFYFRQPHAAMPAISDQALQRALRRAGRRSGIWGTGPPSP